MDKFNFLKKEWPLILLILIPFIVSILVYPYMPEKVPTHWNVQGEVDQYSSKAFGTFFLPFLNIFLYVLYIALPKIDPKKKNYQKFFGSYILLRYITHIFFILIFAVTIFASLGYSIDIGLWVSVGVSILFILMGNVMSRVRHNYFVGFKLPWTLANEEVWRKTHLIGSKLMVAGGVVALFTSIFTTETTRFALLMTAIFLPIAITTIYSFLAFRKTE